MTKTSKFLASVLLVLLVILAAGVLLRSHHNTAPHTFSEHTFSEDELATATALNGEMTKREAVKLDRINTIAEKQGLITEEDLSFVLNLLKTQTESSNPFAPSLRRAGVMIALKNVKNFTPDQEDRVYHAVSPLLASSNNLSASFNGLDITGAIAVAGHRTARSAALSSIRLDKTGAIAVMGNIKDKRALPALTQLLQDPDPEIRSFVRYTIKLINS